MRLRHDHGSQYMSDDFQAEIAFLGMESSPAFVRQPEGNGCAGRFIRTQKEQLLWGRTFQTVEELRQALRNLVSGTPNVGSSSTMVTSPAAGSAAAPCATSCCMNRLSSVSNRPGALHNMPVSCRPYALNSNR